MIKKFLLFFALIMAGLAGYLYFEYFSRPILLTPYPFSFNDNAMSSLKKEVQKEMQEAENSKILILGDRMGANLSKYTPIVIDELAKRFKNPPIAYNWSRPNEGLHRTLLKLKSLKHFPAIIIYHGASSELFEKTFDVNDKSAILKNFEIYDNEKLISLIITFPILSKFIYKKMTHFKLGTYKEYTNRLPSPLKMSEKEISFKIFQYEVRELIDLVKDKKSNLIFITTPLNLEVRPHEICSHSTSNSIIERQQEIEELIKLGNFKDAYTQSLSLSKATYSNALSFYLLGKASIGIGQLAMARLALQQASVFDCSNWRGNAVYNAIIKKEAKTRQVMLIDFDQYTSSAISKDEIFQDEIFPQTIFYQNIMNELTENLKKVLSVD